MKILFLDFDGVINSLQSVIYHRRKFLKENGTPGRLLIGDFCPIACSNVQRMLEKCPDLHIVVSSSWRINRSLVELRNILSEEGIDPQRVIGKTDSQADFDEERGHQIQRWLDRHPEVTEFVIVDDDSDMAHLGHKLVKTSMLHGFMYGDMVRALKILGVDHAS